MPNEKAIAETIGKKEMRKRAAQPSAHWHAEKRSRRVYLIYVIPGGVGIYQNRLVDGQIDEGAGVATFAMAGGQ